ncbi:MAG: hypothetical protein JO257_13590 [Deltaproteobacteria bacterium]|nr:hypothetical protein [Deltaproteobacteria bacterium]
MRLLRALFVLAACGHGQPRKPAPVSGDELTFYRDVTVVRQRIELAGATHVRVAEGVTAKDVRVLEGGGSVVSGVLGDVIIEAGPGHHSIVISYTTTAVHWEAAYTLTARASRDRAVLAGALAIRNATGIPLHGAAHVVDAELATATTPDVTPRDLGELTLPSGDSRVPLVAGAPRRMHAVLVYDPIGTKLDNPSPVPLRDASLGVADPVASRVSESFEVDRDPRETRGLPAGPVRLLEEHDDGSLRILGEARLFDAATRRSDVDTIAIGTAEGVTGKRERRELTDEETRHRLVEEFVITIDNTRARPVDVVVREHLYRGLTWAVAYESVPDVHQDGAQAFTMRTRVAARGQVKIMYVVVYTWGT